MRDVSLIIGFSLLKTITVPVEIFPTILGKAATAFNMLALVFLMASTFKPILTDPFIAPLVMLAAFVTLSSFIQYTIKWFAIYRKKER